MLLPVYPNRVSLQKVGVSFQKDEVFGGVKRSFSTTNSSFSQNKTPFSAIKYAVLFSSIAKIFYKCLEGNYLSLPLILAKFSEPAFFVGFRARLGVNEFENR